MGGADHDLKSVGISAFERHDWDAAFESLRPLHEQGVLTPAEEMILTEAAMIIGEMQVASRASERAARAFEEAQQPGEAAIACVFCYRLAADQNKNAVAMGWLSRADRLAAQAGDHPATAHVEVAKAFVAYLNGDDEQALELATDAERIARAHGEPAVEALAVNRIGRVLIRLGRVQEGQARIDEAMTAVTAGAVARLPAFIVYCSTIDACADLEDYRRAGDWTREAKTFCDDRDFSRWVGICRVHRAELWRLHGAWEVAARELEEACEVLERSNLVTALGEGFREKGIQRLQVGDLDGAEQAFREAHARGANPQPGLARLWLLQGKVEAAINALDRTLEDLRGRPLARAKVLPTYVEAALAADDLDRGEEGANELEAIAEDFKTSGLRARAHAARGAVELAGGDAKSAVATLRRAIQAWHEIGAPYEVARLRGLLANAYDATGEPEAAALERDAARVALDRLGASPASGDGAEMTSDPPHAPTASASDSPTPKLIAGKLEIVRKLGEGGMGTVYLARHRITGREVAVKLLRPGTCDAPGRCERLLQEALASGQIRHPNVIDVYDAGMHDGAPYLVLEYLRGESVAERLSRVGTVDVPEALDIVEQTLAGVGAAHARGIVHRDLKPDNLFIVTAGAQEQVKVLDFGIAKLDDGGVAAPTRTGALVGTPHYMAPEQFEGGELDGRVDLYAIGVVLFELLTGEVPFHAESYGSLLLAIMSNDFPSCRDARPELSVELDELIKTATARDPAERFADAAAFAERARELRGAT